MGDVDLDTTIKTLSVTEAMSVRATNICLYNNLNNLYLILDHYVSNGNFLDLRNCGKRTNMELVRISQKYIHLYPLPEPANNEPPDSVLLPPPVELPKKKQLSQLQKSILTNFIHIKIKLLSVRFYNALRYFLNGEVSFDSFDRQILSIPNIKIYNIKRMGKKSFVELKYLIHIVNDYIDIITRYNDTELLRELYVTCLQRFYEIEEEGLRFITSDYDFSRGIPVFKTIFFLAKFKKIFSDSEKNVFFSESNRYIDFTVDNPFVESVELNLTRERIRQISKTLPSKLFNNIKKIFREDFHSYRLNTYSCNQRAEFIYVNSNLLKQIRITEKVSFTQQFVTFILSALFEDTHFLLGDKVWFDSRDCKDSYYQLKNFYLINRQLKNIFNFREFVQHLFNTFSSQNRKHSDFDTDLDYYVFLSQFFYADDYSSIPTIAEICKTIIKVEFPGVIILNNRIIFQSSMLVS